MNENLKKIEVLAQEKTDLEDNIDIANYISKKLSSPSELRRVQLEKDLLSLDKSYLSIVHEFYEYEMACKAEPESILLLFCLESQIYSGFKAKVYDSFKRDFLVTYGMENVFLLRNLEISGFLKKNERNKYYQICLEQLNLINRDINLIDPNDTSYIFSGYCPITIRLIEKLTSTGLSPIINILLLLPGPKLIPEDEYGLLHPVFETNIILLIFIGGVTLSEVSAIRFLNSLGGKYKFMIVTTNIIKGEDIIREMKDNRKEEII